MITVHRKYTFEAAHSLPRVPRGHRCGRLHGHTYRLQVWARGKFDHHAGWIRDFADIDRLVKSVLSEYDHHELNKRDANPTVENIAALLFQQIEFTFQVEQLRLVKLQLDETDRGGVTIELDVPAPARERAQGSGAIGLKVSRDPREGGIESCWNCEGRGCPSCR